MPSRHHRRAPCPICARWDCPSANPRHEVWEGMVDMTTEVTPRPTGRGSRGSQQSGRPAAVSSGRRQRNRASAVLMAPFFLLLAMVFVAPLLTALWMSFFAQDSSGLGFGPVEQSFVGLRSYTAVLGDPTFMGSLGLILIFCLVYIPIVTRSEEHTSELQSRGHLVCR